MVAWMENLGTREAHCEAYSTNIVTIPVWWMENETTLTPCMMKQFDARNGVDDWVNEEKGIRHQSTVEICTVLQNGEGIKSQTF